MAESNEIDVSAIEGMVSSATVTDRLNQSMNWLYYHDSKNDSYHPPVCLICDQFTGSDWTVVQGSILKRNRKRFKPYSFDIVPGLRDHYRFQAENAQPWMAGELLSPRSRYVSPNTIDQFPLGGYILCKECATAFNTQKGYCSKAIGNGWTFGIAPEELTSLTEAELSILTPVRTFGYCFTYVGGRNTKLQGTLGYYKVSQESIAEIAEKGCVLADILRRKTVFISHGNMTAEQQHRVSQKKSVNPYKLKRAIKWLIRNNHLWSHIKVEDVDSATFPEPEHINMARTVESATEDPDHCPEDASAEQEDSFHVFFPDKTMTSMSGGQTSSNEFRRLVREAQSKGWEGHIVADMSSHFTKDYVENNFALASILQMPYGRGGIEENRHAFGSQKKTSVLSMADYADHLAYMSIPAFHRPMFVLQLYNLHIRGNILRTVRSRLHGNRSLQNLRTDLDLLDLKAAAEARGRRGYTNVGNPQSRAVLKSLDAVAASLPHSDESSKRARQWMNAMSFKFGLAGFFLTVTPDDENSFLVTLYSQTDKNGNRIELDSLSNDELRKRSSMRKETRLNFPGITSLNFMYCLDAILYDVVGWNVNTNTPRSSGGLFGTPAGYAGAVEEQGRTTLHVHLIIFLPGYRKWMDEMADKRHRSQLRATKYIKTLVSNTISTEIIKLQPGMNISHEMKKFTDHKCSVVNFNKRKRPRVVDDQEIRNLRHKSRHKTSTTLMYCEHCQKKWSSEAFMRDYARNYLGIDRIESIPAHNKYLDNVVYDYTKPGFPRNEVIASLIHIRYDLHATKHCTGCFKNSIGNKKAVWNKDECRMRLPDIARLNFTIVPMFTRKDESNEVPYFGWDGEKKTKQYFTVAPKRSAHDAFGNSYVGCISESMIGGNTNGRIISPGPTAIYSTKYPMKDNQKAQEEPYEPVVEGLTKMMHHPQRHDVEKYESLRMLTASGFIQNKTNIVGAPMAGYLLRRRSRFLFSHQFAFIPINDMKSLLKDGEVTKPFIRFFKQKPYADITALNYLCRPRELEATNLMDFMTKFKIRKFEYSDEERNRCMEFTFKPFCAFDHPTKGFKTNHLGMPVNLQAVEKLETTDLIPWLPNFMFKDTAIFKANILSCGRNQITPEMEDYAFTILIMFHPLRTIFDIQEQGSFVLKLRMFVASRFWKDEYAEYLQNVQDVLSNYCRVHPSGDELQCSTNPYREADSEDNEKSDDAEDDHILQGTDLDHYWEEILREVDGDGNDGPQHGQKDNEYLPERLDFGALRDKGGHQCGRRGICKSDKYNLNSDSESPNVPLRTATFLQKNSNSNMNFDPEANDAIPQMADPQYRSRKDVIRIVLTRNGNGGGKRFGFFPDDKEDVHFPEASGSASSIIQWGLMSGVDKEQRRAFEIFASSFVLSFYRDALREEDDSTGLRDHEYLRHRNSLLKLSGRVAVNLTDAALSTAADKALNDSTRCFLHGPGGSGKSAVLEMLSSYCEEFCSFVGEEFNRYTILNTAFSGVAATMINGRTVHSACHVNKQIANIPPEDKENWRHTRMLIMDEISFASTTDLEKINTRCQILKDNCNALYGGIDVIFCGDMRQLEPIGKNAATLYERNDCHAFQGAVNCYIELHGKHRFKNDPAWGDLLGRLREGCMTSEDVDMVNSRIATSDLSVPRNVSYATYRNTDRTSIHMGILERYAADHKNPNGELEDAVVVLSSKLEVRDGSKVYNTAQNRWEMYFFQNCGEGDCNSNDYDHSRFDPALVLYPGRPVMLNTNRMFSLNVANGTRAIVERIVLKHGQEYGTIDLGFAKLKSARAHNIDRVVLRKEGTNDYFEVGPRLHHFHAQIPTPETLSGDNKRKKEKVAMRGQQLPIICNNATTCHKLQGASIDKLYIHCWSTVRNWVYVVLSRVRTIDGLTTRLKLEKGAFLDKLNEIPTPLKRMIKDFRDCHLQKALEDSEYERIIMN